MHLGILFLQQTISKHSNIEEPN